MYTQKRNHCLCKDVVVYNQVSECLWYVLWPKREVDHFIGREFSGSISSICHSTSCSAYYMLAERLVDKEH